MEEIWKDVYFKEKICNREVSNHGEVRKKDTKETLYPADNGAGYLSYSLCNTINKYGKKATQRQYIHRLVAEAFLPNPDNLKQVNHLDCNKSNNRVDNLEWASGSSNILHAHKEGRMKKRSELEAITVLTVEQVIDLYLSVKRDGVGVSQKARDMGIPRTTASSILNKRSRKDITNKLDEELDALNHLN